MHRSKYITIKQQSKTHKYVFECAWARAGGPLEGSHFLSDICTTGKLGDNTSSNELTFSDGCWILADSPGDPDYLFYLWKMGRGDNIGIYLEMDELLALYKFYKDNGFLFMLPQIVNIEQVHQGNNCNIF